MKKAISAMALAAALAAGSAHAADLPSIKAPPVYVPPPVFSWTGFYAGLNLGGGWVDRHNDFNNGAFFPFGFAGFNNNNGGSNAGVVGGLQIGYNYQFSPMFVVGVETDFQGTSIGSHNDDGFFGGSRDVRVHWFGTVRGRAGISLLDSRLLVYGTGGFAYGEVRHPFGGAFFFNNNNNNDIHTGWTAGGGVEYAFLPNWSAKVEYLYTELTRNNNDNNFFDFNFNRRTRINTVRAGVNYHFNLFTPAPVVARY